MAKNKLIALLILVSILFLITIVLLITKTMPTGKVIEQTELTLPANTVKLSECVPEMGEHWANPTNMPFGPIYLVDKGKVVGIEYMIHEDELEENIMQIGEEKVGKPVVMTTLNAVYDHIELNYLPAGHEGDVESHYDVHMYLVSADEQKDLCK